MTGEFLPLSNDSICCLQHILNKNTISPCRIIDENMSHSAHQFAILNDGAAAHALDDAAGFGKQVRVRDFDQKIPAVAAVFGIDLQNFHRILLYAPVIHRGADMGTAGADLVEI